MPQNEAPIYIVTGATGAIGQEIAKALARQGHAVLLACRNTAKAGALKELILSAREHGEVMVEELRLDSMESISRFAASVTALSRPVAALVNNAGVMCRHRSLTADGIEQTIAVNYLGTALLSLLLLPTVASGGRIAFTTSITRRLHSLKEPVLDEPDGSFSQLGTYGRSKLALTHFALYLAGLPAVAEKGVKVNCADPGIVNSAMITMNRWFDPLANLLFRPFISTPATGARAMLRAVESGTTAQIYKPKGKPLPIAADLKSGDTVLRSALMARTMSLLSQYGLATR